jgi:flagellar biosynthesis/type III secretory pathway protein FliH
MRAQPKKFGFDQQFDAQPANLDIAAELRGAELSAARAEAEHRGFEQGLAAARSVIEGITSASLESISAQLHSLFESQKKIEAQLQKEAGSLALALADALSGAALKRFPLERVAEIIHRVLSESLMQSRIAIRLHPDVLESAKHVVDDIAISLGFSGRLIFIASDDCQLADVDIEWALGGVSAHTKDIKARLTAEMSQLISYSSEKNSQ